MADENENNFTVFTSDNPEEQPRHEDHAAPVENDAEEKKEEDGEPQPQEPKKEENPEKAEENDDAYDPGEERKQKPRYQKRIDRLTKRVKDAERRLQQYETNQDEDEEIDPTDFESYEDYDAALKKQKPKSPKVAPEQQALNEAIQDLEDPFDDAREKYSDFDELIRADDLKISTEMVIALSETDNAGDVAYYLGNNKKEAARIAGLSATRQAIEIGKLSIKVGDAPVGEPKQPKKKTTQAPEPIEPVSGSDDPGKKSPDQQSFREFEKSRNEAERKRGSFWN